MIETYLEQNVSVDDPSRNKTKRLILSILKFINLGLGIISFFLMFFLIVDAEGNLIQPLGIVIVIMFPVMFTVSFFFLRRAVFNINTEYDYVLNGSKFIIVRVLNKSKRKKYLTLEVSEFSEIGKVTLPSFEKIMQGKPKEYLACANINDDNYYLVTRYNDERCVVYLEFNEAMLTAITRTLGRSIIIKK